MCLLSFLYSVLSFRCPFLHRTAGDTERRYHLRYYKTGSCIHETDSKGNCSKNGSHCAFAHGSHDLRSPVYDIRCPPKNTAQTICATWTSLSIRHVIGVCWAPTAHCSFCLDLAEKCRWWKLRVAPVQQKEAEGTGSRGRQRARLSSRRSWARSRAGKVR